MKSALEQVSDLYEEAKREECEIKRTGAASPLLLAVLNERVRVWGHAFHILQSQKGNFVG